ncbi:MAG TPA: Trp biosynthesis-associated membrane protein [Streptosporangiaceae bacterium]|nr:Trp biosynthesis-associated membrane protein [Streptosporangiaceae bacterium]
MTTSVGPTSLRGSLARRGSAALRPASARRALAMTLLLAAAGAGIAFLATRQGWAQVRTTPPRPLPASVQKVTGSAMVPYADALVVAGLASLAAILATRRVWRRVSGILLAAIGAGLAASAFAVSRAAALAAVAATIGPASNPGDGSVTSGAGGPSSPAPDLVSGSSHVTIAAAQWQALVVIGAVLMIAAGVLVAWKPASLAVMSSKYDAPTGDGPRSGRSQAGSLDASRQEGQPADSASIWEALSRGDDPTAGGRRASGA